MTSAARLNKYIWLIDTIRRHGPITLANLSKLWQKSHTFNGQPLPRRTFYQYKKAIEEIFDIQIVCNTSTFEYYIDDESGRDDSMSDWLLNTMATNQLLSSSRDISDRIFVEEVPSARKHLGTAINAIKTSRRIKFDYHPYTRSKPTTDIVMSPYLLKIFKQRWYLTGFVHSDSKIKTYALDRITKAAVTETPLEDNPEFDPAGYFHDSFGIVVTASKPRRIVLKVDSRQAKYFRALPLHHSQHEMLNDEFSLFTYTMRISQDLVAELLSYGPKVTVLEPRELKVMMEKELRDALANYGV